jgi:putative flavoprotein involved in K+ transport
VEKVETLIVGGGQAGLMMSAQLRQRGRPHVIVERHRIAERWRTERWDALHANGPAWHDRFPDVPIAGVDPDGFATRDQMVDYFTAYAAHIEAPIRCGVDVTALHRKADGTGFHAETSAGPIQATNVVAATGPFQRGLIPPLVPPASGITQMHSTAYRNPDQLPPGAVLVVGAGSSGAQIADELSRAGRRVFLCVGQHERPPRRYRGKDFCFWLGVLGLWDAETRDPAKEHVTIAVSGAYGGHTMDFRRLAARGITLLGRADAFADGVMRFAPGLARDLAGGDANYLSLLDAADAYAVREGLNLPEEPSARVMEPEPSCVTTPILRLDLPNAGITTIIWATGFAFDFGWLQVGALDARGAPIHQRGITDVPGLYVLGLPFLSRRASSFIFGVEQDAARLADHITAQG